MRTEKDIKLHNFMAYCNKVLLSWKPELTAEFEGDKIYIRKLKGYEFFTAGVMSEVLSVAEDIGLSCFFEQKDGKVQIEVMN